MVEFVERKRWLFFGLPFTFTKYTVKEDIITINSGLLKTAENDCYMYKVQDVELKVSFWERMFKLGTVECHTGDNTNPVLKIEHIKNAKAVKDFVLEMSEKARIRRRTMTMLDISAGSNGGEIDDVDLDDLLD